MNKVNVRALVEGAILAAVTVIMGVFYMVPALELIALLWPVPIILIGYRHGFRVSIISTVVAALIIALLVNPVVGLVLLLVYALPGALIGVMLNRKQSPYIVVLTGGLVLGCTLVLQIALMFHVLFNKDVFYVLSNFGAEIDNYYNSFYTMLIQTTAPLKSFGFNEDLIQQMLDFYKAALTNVKIILPSSLALTGIFISYANFKVVRIILNRLGHHIEDIKEFSKWRIRENLVAPTLILTLLILALNFVKASWVQNIYMNIFILVFVVYGVLGLSVVTYLVRKIGTKYEIPKPLQNVFVVVIFLMFYYMLAFVGMFDLTADIRRLNKNTTGGVK